MDLELKDTVTFVAGASRGLGKAIADAMAREGSHVAITARGEDTLNAAAEEIGRHGTRVLPIAVDLTDRDAALGALARTREELGPIDSLVINAGGSRGEKTSAASDDEWDEVLDLNFRAGVTLARSLF